MKRIAYTLLAFSLTSLLPAIYLASRDTVSDAPAIKSFFSAAIIFFPFSLLATLVLGVIPFIIATRYHLISWYSCLAAGIIAGILVSLFLRPISSFNLDDLATLCPLGAVTGLLFWLVWRIGES